MRFSIPTVIGIILGVSVFMFYVSNVRNGITISHIEDIP